MQYPLTYSLPENVSGPRLEEDVLNRPQKSYDKKRKIKKQQ